MSGLKWKLCYKKSRVLASARMPPLVRSQTKEWLWVNSLLGKSCRDSRGTSRQRIFIIEVYNNTNFIPMFSRVFQIVPGWLLLFSYQNRDVLYVLHPRHYTKPILRKSFYWSQDDWLLLRIWMPETFHQGKDLSKVPVCDTLPPPFLNKKMGSFQWNLNLKILFWNFV